LEAEGENKSNNYIIQIAMDNYEINKLIEKHGNYRYLFMNEEQLKTELNKWCRQDLILWLQWNDPNGIYDDESSLTEMGTVMTCDEGVEIMMKQILQKN
jgi:hypothetical protein